MVELHLYDQFRIGKSIETERWLVVGKDLGQREVVGNGEWLLTAMKIITGLQKCFKIIVVVVVQSCEYIIKHFVL